MAIMAVRVQVPSRVLNAPTKVGAFLFFIVYLMAVVYVIYSSTLDSYYVGSCMDFKIRLEQHLASSFQNSYTKKANDWKEYLLFDDLEYMQARQIEAYIKRMKSVKYIKNLKRYEEMRVKLIEKYTTGSPR